MIRLLPETAGTLGAKEQSDPCTRDTVVVIPADNDRGMILRTIAGVLSCTDRTEILFLDGEPADGISSIVRALCVLNNRIHYLQPPSDSRFGARQKAGLEWALHRGYEYIVQMNADMSHDPFSLLSLLDQAERCDVAIGSKYCSGGAVAFRPILHRMLSLVGSQSTRGLLRIPVRDLTSGFKCWRRGFLETLNLSGVHGDGVGFHMQMTLLAHGSGARISEVPILFADRPRNTSRKPLGMVLHAALRVYEAARMCRLQRLHMKHDAACRGLPRSSRRPARRLFLALGGIGDTVLTFAAARRLRSAFPDDHLTVLTMWPQSAELLEDLGVFDEVIQHHFQNRPWRESVALILRLHRRRFDTSILTFPANRFEYNVVQWLIHAKRRVGHEYLRGSHLTYLRCLLTDRVPQTRGAHNVLENLRLLGPLGLPARSVEADVSLGPVGPGHRQAAELLLPDSDRPLIGIHAGSSTYKNLHAKRWPVERFAELCNRVIREDGCIPVLFGGPQDEALNSAIQDLCPAAERLKSSSIRRTSALIQRCTVFVSNDSALAHLASALSVPTVMVVGPTDGLEVGPYSKSGCVVSAPLNCSPCFRVGRAPLRCIHPHRFRCMNAVDVDRVLCEVRNRLSIEHSRIARGANPRVCDDRAKWVDESSRVGARDYSGCAAGGVNPVTTRKPTPVAG